MNESTITNDTEIQELLKKAEECRQLIEDAENMLDAVLEDLEEALAEAYEGDPE